MSVAVDPHGQEDHGDSSSPSMERSHSGVPMESPSNNHSEDHKEGIEGVSEPPSGRKRRVQSRADREAALARRDQLDDAYLSNFDPHTAWLPPNTKPSDYTPEFCAILERRYWRNCGLGKPPWYGADSAGMLSTNLFCPVFIMPFQAPYLRTRQHPGTSPTFLQLFQGLFHLPTVACLVSICLTCTSACGGQPLRGMLKTWIFSQ